MRANYRQWSLHICLENTLDLKPICWSLLLLRMQLQRKVTDAAKMVRSVQRSRLSPQADMHACLCAGRHIQLANNSLRSSVRTAVPRRFIHAALNIQSCHHHVDPSTGRAECIEGKKVTCRPGRVEREPARDPHPKPLPLPGRRPSGESPRFRPNALR